MQNSKVFLIDASPIFYKSFFAIQGLTSKNGVPTNAVYGFCLSLLKILNNHNPKHIVICFDHKVNFRKNDYSGYKEDRKPMDGKLLVQIPLLKEVISAFGIKAIDLEGYEADDLIGTLATIAKNLNQEVYVLSPDKDMAQLVDDKVKILDTKNEIMDSAKVVEKFELKPEQIVDFLGIAGDQSDGIPGILGIGKKTAIKLLKTYGSLEGIFANIDKIEGKLKDKLENGKKLGLLSKQLATIKTNLDLPFKDLSDFEKGYIQKEKLKNLCIALNFNSIIGKIDSLED